MLLLAASLKLVAEVALLSLIGRWLLGLLAGAKRDSNLFYQALTTLIQPFIWLVRRMTPRVVVDRHIPVVTFLLLSWVWVFALTEKVALCRASPLEALCT